MNKKEEFERALHTAMGRQGGSRLQRVMRSPYRMIAPVIDRKIGRTRPVSCPTFFGETFNGLLPEAVTTQVWRSTAYSPEVCRAIMHVLEPGDSFVDIGSHFGFFSLLAANLVGPGGRTFSIEAMPETFGYLSRNMAGFIEEGRSQVHHGAAFDTETTLTFKDFGIVASSLNTAFENRGASGLANAPRDVTVEARRGDDILSEAGIVPKLIKIDAESAEVFVLRGLENTLRTHRPALILELGDTPGDAEPQSATIWKILDEVGYDSFVFEGPEPTKFPIESPVAYANVLFLPSAR